MAVKRRPIIRAVRRMTQTIRHIGQVRGPGSSRARWGRSTVEDRLPFPLASRRLKVNPADHLPPEQRAPDQKDQQVSGHLNPTDRPRKVRLMSVIQPQPPAGYRAPVLHRAASHESDIAYLPAKNDDPLSSFQAEPVSPHPLVTVTQLDALGRAATPPPDRQRRFR